MAKSLFRINEFLQAELMRRGLREVSAVEAGRWLDIASLLPDSLIRPGLPLRNLLRNGEIMGAEQRPPQPNGRWFIVLSARSIRSEDAVREASEPNSTRLQPPPSGQHRASLETQQASLDSAAPDHEVIKMIGRLVNEAIPVTEVLSWSDSPGVYAFVLVGNAILAPTQCLQLHSPTLLYIGKTETSQEERDARTHLANGETGHSSLRRTLAALLRESLNLTPIPRSATETSDRRFAHFGLDAKGDAALTKWMRDNLAVSFVPVVGGITELKSLELRLIQVAHPPLNDTHNPDRTWPRILRGLRRQCAKIARGVEGSSH